MKTSVTVVFVFLFAAVAALYVYLIPAEDMQVGEPEPPAMKLLPLEDGDVITTIEIQNREADETITLTREEGRWTMIYPVLYEADERMIEGLSRALTLSAKARRLSPEKEWSEYGLKDPALKVGVETRNKKERRYLYFGDKAPIGDYVFARWGNERDYFLINADLKRSFDRSPYSLREKSLVRTPLKRLDKIRVQTLYDQYEIVRREEGWVWMEPVFLLGDDVEETAMSEFLTLVKNIYIKEFLDSDTSTPSELGFSSEGNRISLWREDAELPETIHIGIGVPERDAYYGQREGEGLYFLVASGNIHSFFTAIQTMARDAGAPVSDAV